LEDFLTELTEFFGEREVGGVFDRINKIYGMVEGRQIKLPNLPDYQMRRQGREGVGNEEASAARDSGGYLGGLLTVQ